MLIAPRRLFSRLENAVNPEARIRDVYRIQVAFSVIVGVGWHTFRHSVGSILADMGEHQLTIRDYLRHSNLNVTNQYLQATSNTKRLAQDKLVDAILPSGHLSASKSSLIQ
jgi:integrase